MSEKNDKSAASGLPAYTCDHKKLNKYEIKSNTSKNPYGYGTCIQHGSIKSKDASEETGTFTNKSTCRDNCYYIPTNCSDASCSDGCTTSELNGTAAQEAPITNGSNPCPTEEELKKINERKELKKKIFSSSNFLLYIIVFIIGFKVYYFNLNLEFYFKQIKFDNANTILLKGGYVNKTSEKSFENFFGEEINSILLNKLKQQSENWFLDYIFNLKLDFSFYFLKMMDILNKLKLTRYLVFSVLLGGFGYVFIMLLMFFILCFFSIYGLIRVFNMKMSYLIFAACLPFLLMHYIVIFTLIYYTFKLLIFSTNKPFEKHDDNTHNVDILESLKKNWQDKLVLLSYVLIYFFSSQLSNSTGNKPTSISFIVLSVLFCIYHLFKCDYFFKQDKEYIANVFKRNAGQILFFLLIIAFVSLLVTLKKKEN